MSLVDNLRGYGLVVEHVLAKNEAGFRLPLPAQRKIQKKNSLIGDFSFYKGHKRDLHFTCNR